MTDDTKPAAKSKQTDADGPVAFAAYTDEGNGIGLPLRDFADHASAVAQAEALGGEVEHIGTAFHVRVKGDE